MTNDQKPSPLLPRTPVELVAETLNDPAFQAFHTSFAARNVRTWSSLEERALLFGLAKATGGHGCIVELGSYCGGSASFFAQGLAASSNAPSGKVICVDPLLGAPPWLAVPADLATLAELRANLAHFKLTALVEIRIGDSASVGAIWPALPIDVLLIDGDHSFEGALRDIENWVPKIRAGGTLIFDDIDDIAEMRELDTLLRNLRSIDRVGAIGGSGIYVIRQPGWDFLAELQPALARIGHTRPWSYAPVHDTAPAGRYRHTRLFTDPCFDIGYDLAFLGVQQDGDHGLLAGSPAPLSDLARSVHADRNQGDFHVLANPQHYTRSFRALFCRPSQAAAAAALLLPGGVIIAWDDAALTPETVEDLATSMRNAGLDGVGYGPPGPRPVFWGVGRIGHLTPLAVINGLMASRRG